MRRQDETEAQPQPADRRPVDARPPVHRVLSLQASIGNAATARLLRSTGLATPEHPVHPEQAGPMGGLDPDRTEFVTVDPAPALPPDVAARLVAVQTTLRHVPKLKEEEQAILRKALPGAPVLDLIEQRDMRRGWLENLPAMIGRLMPPAGQPDESAAYQIHSLEQTAEGYRRDLEELQPKIDAIVAQTGARSEAELVRFIEHDFPRLFIARAKAIANRQLWDNLNIAEAEGRRYGVGVNPAWGTPGTDKPYVPGRPRPEEAPALRAAAKELIGFRRRREEAEANFKPFGRMEDEWAAAQAGNPDPSGQMAMQAAQTAEAEARTRIGLQFPVLFRADLDKIAGASDAELSQQVCDQLVTLDYNIKQTIKHIREDELEIWSLRGIVELTMIDLGIAEDSPLIGVVKRHVEEAKADKAMLDMALTALQITAALVATVASGGLALGAAAVAVGIGVHQLAGSIDDYMKESFAGNVALDPEIADISVNEPRVMPIVLGVLALGLDGAAAVKAITALRAPARALLAGGDMPDFIGAAYKALPEPQARQLIERAALLPEVTAKAAQGARSRGAAWTPAQIQELFVRAFKSPGPPEASFFIHKSEAAFETAAMAAGIQDARGTAGFWMPASDAVVEGGDVVAAMGKIHLPPTASTLTVIHESLHMMSRQSGFSDILGRYLDEGMTELLAREAVGPAAGRAYEANIVFVERLAKEIGGIDLLRDAYLHSRWGPLRAAVRARFGGSEFKTQRFYGLLRRVGPEGQRSGVLDAATQMLFPAP